MPTLPSCSLLITVLLAAALARPLVGAESGGIRLTLADALERVDGRNPSVLVARESVQQALALAERERSNLLPRLTVEVAQRRTRSATFEDNGSTRTNTSDRGTAVVSGSVTAFSAANLGLYAAARQAARVAEINLDALEQDIFAAVAATYLTHLRNLKRGEVIESAIERAKVLLELAQRQLEAGVATQIDVTRAEARLAESEQARLQQETVVVESELLLKRLLDLPFDEPLVLEEFAVSTAAVRRAVEPAEAQALARRADWRVANEALRQNELEVRAARYQRVPTLRLTGEWGYAGPEIYDTPRESIWFAGVTLSFPLFDGAQIGANTRLAQSRLRAQEQRRRDLANAISAQVRFAVQDTESRRAQIGVATKNRELAAEELRLAQVRYEQGVADNRDLVDAQDSFVRASDNLVEAHFRYYLSRLELARVLGEVRDVLRERQP